MEIKRLTVLALQACLFETGSQKVESSSLPSSTFIAEKAIQQLSIRPNFYTQLATPLQHLIDGFLLSCRVENKSPATISFYQSILNEFQWFLEKYGIVLLQIDGINCIMWQETV